VHRRRHLGDTLHQHPPYRRLGLELGEVADVNVAYIRVPELLVGAERQRYGYLEEQADGGLYRFEALPSGFTAELPVDADGLVIDYPGLFRRRGRERDRVVR
jgi:hypothetical protein